MAKFLKDDPPIFREDEEDVYSIKKTTKELWESLDHKYKTEDDGAKKFLVAKSLNFVMVDSKAVVNQVQEFQLIIHDILAEGMVISESFQVAAIIEKLPPTWNDLKKYLKYKRKEMTVENLIVRLRIEEDNRGPKNGVFKKPKFQGKCFNCNKMRHKSSDYRIPNRVKTNEANAVENIFKAVSDLDLYTVIYEVNLVDSNPREWWLDTGATRQIFCGNDSFVELVPYEKWEKLYMAMLQLPRSRGNAL
ncbi:uncharacterized protein LOC105793094 [Gossypium raimondii]|uniref:uncharacterized protein LOC105793094 n=1 Tax=Gossypium raimondii TaxID=29730 RepID=UPI00063ACF1B|nr:uncharacterized protein LOC105793094 [Gossypium raimondii]